MCPIHIGHEEVIKKMIFICGGVENCLVVIGSSNSRISKGNTRNFFSYKERRNFFKAIFPEVSVVGLPDYHNDNEWLIALDDILSSLKMIPHKVTYFGGCNQDVDFFIRDNRLVYILNRFSGRTPKISSSEVRDCLAYCRPIDKFLNPLILNMVIETFKKKDLNF